jgi:methylated-DNA-[protein]-cysteine S-methyltransferase
LLLYRQFRINKNLIKRSVSVKKIPKGKVSTYKLVAQAIGKPKAMQAVGQALSVNPFAPLVPCHRVLASNGSIGGFFGNSDIMSDNVSNKLKLLQDEGIKFDSNLTLLNTDVYRQRVIHTFL